MKKFISAVALILLLCGLAFGQGGTGGGGGGSGGASTAFTFGATTQNLGATPATASGQCVTSTGAGPYTWIAGSCSGSASTAWTNITAGTNAGQALLIGNGSTLNVTGTGVISASALVAPLFAINPQTATYQALAADFSAYKTISVASGTFTITLVASGSQPTAGQYINIVNYGSGTVTVARSGQNINGGTTSLTIPPGSATFPMGAFVESDGTNYFAMQSGITKVSGDGTIITNSGSVGNVTLVISGTSGGIPCFNTSSSWQSSATLATNALVAGGGAGSCPATGNADFTYATHTLTMGASGIFDVSAGGQSSLKIPIGAGFAPTTDGFIAVNSTTHALVHGSNGTALVSAVAATGTGSSTACASHKWTSTISAIAAPTCTQPADTDISGTSEGALTYVHTSALAELTVGTNGQCLTSNGTDPAWGACGGASSSVLSAITAATGTNTIASGNNYGQIWNWALTSNSHNAFQFGETTAATSGTLGNQYILSAQTLAGSTAVPFNVTCSLTGSQTLPCAHFTPTWNTTGVVDAALLINVTNTASGAASLLEDLQIGGTSQWKVDKSGNVTANGTITSAGSVGLLTATEGVCSGATSGSDVLCADATLHAFKSSLNNGSFVAIPQLAGDFSGTASSPVVSGINGGSVPASAAVLGTNSSKQIVSATAAGVSGIYYVGGGGTAQAQTATLSPAVTSLTNGLVVNWLPLHANTTSGPTLAVNGLAATSIIKTAGAALVANDLTTTAIASAIYDGTNFELQNPQTSGSSSGTVSNCSVQFSVGYFASTGTTVACTSESALDQYAYVAGGGTANAQTATLAPALGAYAVGVRVEWTPTAANTGATTINVNSLGAKTVDKCGTSALVANDLTTAAVAVAVYDGTEFQLQNPQAVPCGSGTQYQVFTMGASVPAWGALNLGQAAAITGSLPNGNLANSAITIAGTSVSLGGSTSSLPSPGVIGGGTPAAATFTSLTTQNGSSFGGTAYSYGAPSTTGGAAVVIPATTYTVTGASTTANFQGQYAGAATFTDASAGTITDAFDSVYAGPAVAAGSLTITRAHTLGIIDSTSAASSITGGLVISATLGTTATSVGIGGGNVNAGGNGFFGGTLGATGHVTFEGVTSTGAQGTGALVFAGSPTLTTAVLGSSTATTQSQLDGSTKVATTLYVDTAVSNAIAAVNPAVAVLAASTSGLTGTYTQVGGGIGDTFTVTATGAFTLDGIAINTIGQRVLLKNQATAAQNGVYTATIVGAGGISPVFTRALDYDTPSDVNNTGIVPVQSGTANSDTSWLLTSQVTSIGSAGSSLTYTQFSINPTTILTATNPTQYGVMLGQGTQALAVTAQGASGTVLIGNGAANPTFSATPTFGAAGTLGSVTFGNATSGLLTVQTATGAITSYTIDLPVAQPSGSNTFLNCTAANPAVCTWAAGGGGGIPYGAGGGTANAQTVTASPVPTLTTGTFVSWLPTAANTAAAVTFVPNGLTTKNLTKCGAQTLLAGDLSTTAPALAVYDGTQWELQNPQIAGCGLNPTAYAIGTVTTSATVTPVNGLYQTATLTAADACAFAFTQPTEGIVTITLVVTQASTPTGTATFTSVKWPGGIVPVMTGTNAAVDIYTFKLDGTNIYGTAAQNMK